MSKNKKKDSPRTHKIMNHPYLALVLMPVMLLLTILIIQTVLTNIIPEIFESYHLDAVTYYVASFLCLLIYKKQWFKGEYTGNLSVRHFKKGMLLLIPTLAFIIVNLTEIDYSTLTAKNVALSFFIALAVGLMEETAFRGLSGANYMRVHPDGKKLTLFATFSAILFGVMHMGNVTAGQALDETLMQVFYAFGVGVLYAAVYFRTGSLLPMIVSHALVDVTSFLTPDSTEALTLGDVIFEGGMGILMAVIGYWFIRRAKREEIKEVWAEKWPAVSKECEASATPETPEVPEELPQT